MIAIYKDMSDLDPAHIAAVVESLEKVFDEDNSGTVGKRKRSFADAIDGQNISSIDINEFMRGFILTTKGDFASKIDYTFRIYDQNGDNQISGQEIKKMANVMSSRTDRQLVYGTSGSRSFRPF